MYIRQLSRFVTLLALSVWYSGIGIAQTIPRLGVCEALQKLEVLSGKIVAVQGGLQLGRHDFALGETHCDITPETDGVKWPNAVSLVFSASVSSNSSDADPRSVEFALGLSRLAVNTYVLGSPPIPPPVQISATFIGRLHTRSGYRPLRTPAGLSGTGFGFMGFYPAELEVIAVRDLVISGLPAKGTSNQR